MAKNKKLSESMKGNKNALGNNGGRPPHYSETEELDLKITEYFEFIKGEKDKSTGDWIRKPEPPTVTGLSLYLGFCDKSSLYDYLEKPKFFHYIKRGLTMVEKHHEISIALGDKCTGNIFALKNMGWYDKKEINHKNNGGSFQSIEEKKKRIEELKQKLEDSDNLQ